MESLHACKRYTVIIKGKYYPARRPTHTLCSLNDLLSAYARHPQAGARLKRDMQNICAIEISRQLRGIRFKRPIKLHYRVIEADERRDWSNVLSVIMKVFEDALQQTGKIRNDNQKCVVGFSQDFSVDRKDPRIEITIEEENDD